MINIVTYIQLIQLFTINARLTDPMLLNGNLTTTKLPSSQETKAERPSPMKVGVHS